MFALQSTPYPSSPEVSSRHMKARQWVGDLFQLPYFISQQLGAAVEEKVFIMFLATKNEQLL